MGDSMNAKPMFYLLLVLVLFFSVSTIAQPTKRKSKNPNVEIPSLKDSEIRAMLLKAQTAAEEAQTEARRAREMNESLQRQLASNTDEIDRLRQVITAFSAQLADVKSVEPKGEVKDVPALVAAVVPAVESLKSEVETLKEQVDVHTAQISQHAQTKVESASKYRVKLHGLLIANTYLNTNDSSLDDVPLFAELPGTISHRNNLGATLRQSRIGLTLDGPNIGEKLGNARMSAEAEFDFWAGANTEVLGQFRIITASARLDWEKTSFIVGQRPLLISPRNPTSYAALWFAPLHQAGNLWQWRPQIMVEHRIKTGENSELQLQGGIIAPFGESVRGQVIEGGAGYQSRLVWSHRLENERNIEFGFGGYFHRRPFPLGRHVNSFAFTTDWQIPLGNRFEISGETYMGRALGISESAGFLNDRHYAITDSLNNPAARIRGVLTNGGWAQLNFNARNDLEMNLAYGQDDPRNQDIRFGVFAPAIRFKNQAAFANIIYTLRQNFLIALEYRRHWTNYSTSRQTAGHYNLAFGYTF